MADAPRPFVADPLDIVPAEIGGKGRTFFDPPVIDAMLDAITELTAELWACRDRLYVLEQVLDGDSISAKIEQWVPSPAHAAERTQLREALTARVFATFLRNVPAPAAPFSE